MRRRRGPDPSAYRAVFEAVRDAVIVLDGSGRVVDANPVAASSLVGDRNRALGHRLADLLEPASPLVDLLQEGGEVRGHFRSPEGRELEAEIVPLRTPRGGTRGRVVVLRDVTRARAAEAAIRESEGRVRTLLDRSPEGILSVRPVRGEDGEVADLLCLLANDAAERLLELPAGGATGRTLDALGIRRRSALATLLRAVADGGAEEEREFALGRPPAERWVRATALPTGSDVAVTLVDVTRHREREEAMARAALRDPLTGLLNRRGFEESAGRLFPASGSQRRAALLYLDLDRFKPVNDTLGHEAGDELLRRLAGRIRRIVRSGDIAARLGGDEFAILLPGVDPETARRVAGRLEADASRPYTLAGEEVRCPPSIGIALHPADGGDLRALLQAADRAMYVAKSRGGGTVSAGEAAEEPPPDPER